MLPKPHGSKITPGEANPDPNRGVEAEGKRSTPVRIAGSFFCIVFFNLEIRSIYRRVFKSNGAFDIDVRARYIKIEERDAIAEYVMNPPNASGLRRDRQIRMQKPLIETVARTKHQAVPSEADRPLVTVSRHVSNNKNGHASGSAKIT
jgi:hypothetical protein